MATQDTKTKGRKNNGGGVSQRQKVLIDTAAAAPGRNPDADRLEAVRREVESALVSLDPMRE